MLTTNLMEISIKEACHENWNNMTPNEQGAFCGKCVKNVIDFSTKSLEEIKEFFTGREQQNICGRFEDKQLSALSFDAFFEHFRNFEFTKRFVVILFFTFGLCLFDASPAAAQSDSLAISDTATKQPEPITLVNPGTFSNIPVPLFNGQIITTTGTVVTTWVTDWVTPVIVFNEPVKITPGIKPAPLKRKPVDRRRD
jgi:hypothetical protein